MSIADLLQQRLEHKTFQDTHKGLVPEQFKVGQKVVVRYMDENTTDVIYQISSINGVHIMYKVVGVFSDGYPSESMAWMMGTNPQEFQMKDIQCPRHTWSEKYDWEVLVEP